MRISDWSSDVCSSDLAYIHERYRRPLRERMIRALLAWVLPHPRRFRAALSLARLARPGAPLLWRIKAPRPFAALLTLAPARVPSQDSLRPAPVTGSQGSVAHLPCCAEPALRTEYQPALAPAPHPQQQSL